MSAVRPAPCAARGSWRPRRGRLPRVPRRGRTAGRATRLSLHGRSHRDSRHTGGVAPRFRRVTISRGGSDESTFPALRAPLGPPHPRRRGPRIRLPGRGPDEAPEVSRRPREPRRLLLRRRHLDGLHRRRPRLPRDRAPGAGALPEVLARREVDRLHRSVRGRRAGLRRAGRRRRPEAPHVVSGARPGRAAAAAATTRSTAGRPTGRRSSSARSATPRARWSRRRSTPSR